MKYRVVAAAALVALGCSGNRATFAGDSAEAAGSGGSGGTSAMTSATTSGSGTGGQGGSGNPDAPVSSTAQTLADATVPSPSGPPETETSPTDTSETGPESGPKTTSETESSSPGSTAPVPANTSTGADEPATGGVPNTPVDPACEAACCANSDCGEGFECVGSACQCEAGSKECDGACIDEDACCADADCGEASHCAEGACECDDGAHLCDEACASDSSPLTCGAGCEACPVPTGGEAGCDGTQCTASCASGKKLCAGACIANADPCDADCPKDSHDCAGVCALLTSPLACGDSCEPCPVPAHASATCDGEACDFQCNANYMRCDDDTCVPSDGCCGDDDCDSGFVCEANECECASGTMACDGECIPESGCCDDGDCGTGLGCEENQCVDVAPPQVTAITPNGGATGVLSNAAIKITFNEPMDQASVQSALSISTLTTSGYTLAWNGDGSQLTITPTSALTYAAATSLAAGAARSYTVTVAATARDVGGNRMAAGFSSSFTTLRRVTQNVAPTHAGSGSTYGWGFQMTPPSECGTGIVSVGNHVSQAAGGDYITFVQFDLSVVGQTTQVTTFESAKFLATQGAQTGAFYPDGSAVLMRKTYGTMAEAFELTDSANHGDLATSSASSVSKDLSSNFLSLWKSSPLLMYAIEPNGDEPSNTKTTFTCTGFALEVIFLAP